MFYDTKGETVLIPNAAFQVEYISTMTQQLPDGIIISREAHMQVMRDAAGRFKYITNETKSGGKPPAKSVTSVEVLDPVVHKGIAWNDVTTKARAMPITDKTRITVNFLLDVRDGREHMPKDAEPDTVTTKDLGKRTLEGLVCTGTLVTTVVPVAKLGNEQPITITDEIWRLPELQIVAEETLNDPLIGKRTLKLQSITRTEPPQSAFMLPDGYTDTSFFLGGGIAAPR